MSTEIKNVDDGLQISFKKQKKKLSRKQICSVFGNLTEISDKKVDGYGM